MGWRWGDSLALGGALLLGQPLAAQQTRELGVQAIATFSEPELGVLGGYAALRFSARTRVSAGVTTGIAGGDWVGRGELLGHFLLGPERRHKPGFYVAGGIAGVVGAIQRGYLVLTAGVEAAPGSRSGWAVEAGVGGGFRVSLGYRWRRFSLATE
jgi:hypothetical protein